MSQDMDASVVRRKVVGIIFASLLLDLLAFTMPLPLFPRLIASFVDSEKGTKEATTLSRTLGLVRSIRARLISLGHPSSRGAFSPVHNPKWDITLLGGLLGSIFSLCQFLISPHLGAISDRYGRRPVLLATMVGNVLSALLWLIAPSFGLYLVSRVVGGLSEGNVQLAIAIISDVTDAESRGKSLALVGIAFSVCFTFGPILGAWFAAKGFGEGRKAAKWLGQEVNLYAVPAAVTLVLLVVETAYLAVALPETRWLQLSKERNGQTKSKEEPAHLRGATLQEREARLAHLRRLHLLFLLVFSGAEFTLTFLTFDLFSFSSAQNGKLLGLIGVISSFLQGGLTRRSKKLPTFFVATGISSCVASLGLLALLPTVSANASTGRQIDASSAALLYTAAALLAYVSASVVNALNTLASLECDDTDDSSPQASSKGRLPRGELLGKHRSAGQLGRALGPILATGVYWTLGPTTAYGSAAIAMLAVRVLATSGLAGDTKTKTA